MLKTSRKTPRNGGHCKSILWMGRGMIRRQPTSINLYIPYPALSGMFWNYLYFAHLSVAEEYQDVEESLHTGFIQEDAYESSFKGDDRRHYWGHRYKERQQYHYAQDFLDRQRRQDQQYLMDMEQHIERRKVDLAYSLARKEYLKSNPLYDWKERYKETHVRSDDESEWPCNYAFSPPEAGTGVRYD